MYSASTRASSTREKALVVVIFPVRSLGLLYGDMLPILCPKSIWDIPSISELLLDLFPVFRGGRAGQVLVLEFSKDGMADTRDEFTNGGSTK